MDVFSPVIDCQLRCLDTGGDAGKVGMGWKSIPKPVVVI